MLLLSLWVKKRIAHPDRQPARPIRWHHSMSSPYRNRLSRHGPPFHGRTARDQGRSGNPVAVEVVATREVAAQKMSARFDPGMRWCSRVSSRATPHRRKSTGCAMASLRVVDEPRAPRAELRMRVHPGDQVLDSAVGNDRIGIEKHPILPTHDGHARLHPAAKPPFPAGERAWPNGNRSRRCRRCRQGTRCPPPRPRRIREATVGVRSTQGSPKDVRRVEGHDRDRHPRFAHRCLGTCDGRRARSTTISSPSVPSKAYKELACQLQPPAGPSDVRGMDLPSGT